ncbi:MAG: Gfo/Idh/MocA family protein [Anaerolineae bacterium]
MGNLETIGWGILGPGNIAHKFTADLARLPDATLVAVGSRSQARAAAFAETYGARRAYGSYADLLNDAEVEVVYIATPHPFHHQQTLEALRHGKAVLCEKPLAVNALQVEEMIACARAEGRFLMEAMWTRFLPVIRTVRRWLDEGQIGEVRQIHADFGFRGAWAPQERWLNPALAGGALLDVGVYTIAMAQMVFRQQPTTIQAIAHIGETGVDEQTAMVLGYPKGGLALLSCAVRTDTPETATISGTEGMIHIPHFWNATSARLEKPDEEPLRVSGEAGYHFQAVEVMRRLRAGEIQSPYMSWDESLTIAGIMDTVRERIGLRYPME